MAKYKVGDKFKDGGKIISVSTRDNWYLYEMSGGLSASDELLDEIGLVEEEKKERELIWRKNEGFNPVKEGIELKLKRLHGMEYGTKFPEIEDWTLGYTSSILEWAFANPKDNKPSNLSPQSWTEASNKHYKKEAEKEERVYKSGPMRVVANPKDIVINKSSPFSDFIRNASDEEKQEVYKDVLRESIKSQESTLKACRYLLTQEIR